MSIIQEMLRKIHVRLKPYLHWFDATLLLLLVLFVLSGISLAPFHGDESAYLILSEDYDRLVKDGDIGKVLFDPEGKNKQYLRLSTGSILAFTIGFARDVTDNEEPINKWLWGSSWEENVALGNMPSPSLLNLARTCSAVMGAFSVVIFFLFVKDLFASRLAAWVAALAFATQGGVLMNIRRAMQEGPKFLSLTLTVWIAVRILKNLQRMDLSRMPYALLGAVSGLTLAAKQDTAPMLVSVYIALALVPVWKRSPARIIMINVLYLGVAFLLSYASFLAFMPVFWRWWESVFALSGVAIILFQLPRLKTFDRYAKPLTFAGFALIAVMTIISPSLWSGLHIPLVSMIEQREFTVAGQTRVLSDQITTDLTIPTNRMNFLLENTISSRVMYSEVVSFDVPPFHEQIKVYEDSPLSGRTGSLLFDGLLAGFAILGGWALLYKFNAESLFAYSLLLIPGVLLFAILPLPWQRYVLILQIPYLLFSGVGARQLWGWMSGFVV
ncbi:MAG: hypothetical protein Fur0017_26410 [Anaerolineales bacterium]